MLPPAFMVLLRHNGLLSDEQNIERTRGFARLLDGKIDRFTDSSHGAEQRLACRCVWPFWFRSGRHGFWLPFGGTLGCKAAEAQTDCQHGHGEGARVRLV